MITRRIFLKGALAGAAGGGALSHLLAHAAAPVSAGIHIGSCHLGLEEAKLAGLDGIEIPVNSAADKLTIADPGVRQQYKAQMAKTGLAVSSLMLGVLNSNPLASDPRAPAWLEQAIDAAKDLGAGVILVAFFGKGDLLAKDGKLKSADVDVVVQRLKAAAPRARDASVILAIENTLPAHLNTGILDRIDSPWVRVYYDVGNSTNKGYEVPAEIRRLKHRIACVHFKDRDRYLGEGQIQFEPIAAALKEIGYQGWIVMETARPSGNAIADDKRNAAFIRKLF